MLEFFDEGHRAAVDANMPELPRLGDYVEVDGNEGTVVGLLHIARPDGTWDIRIQLRND